MAKAPATPATTDDSFVREVDEEYRKSQLAGFWKRYGIALVVATVVALAALGGYLYWQSQQRSAQGQAGEDFNQALTRLETGNAPAAAPALDRLAGGDAAGYAALAKLTQAANAVQAGDTARAVRLLNAVSGDAALPPPLREVALVKATRLEFDALPAATVIERLKALSVPGNPWFGVAGEMTAIARIKAGQPQLAGPLLASIAKDTSLPASLRGRTQQLAGTLGFDPGPLAPGVR